MNASITSLTEWLDTATATLSAPAKERIQLEIESHFQEAVASHCAQGMTGIEAQARALAELGDAQAAARTFRRSYLTEAEAKVVKMELERWRKGNYLWCCLFFGFVLLASETYYLRNTSFILSGAAVLIMSAFEMLCLWLARRPFSQANVRLAYTLQMLVSVLFTMVICDFRGYPLDWSVYTFIGIITSTEFGRLRLCFKLQRAHVFPQEIQSRCAAISH